MTPQRYDIECFPRVTPHPSFRLAPEFTRYLRDHLRPADLVVLNGPFNPSVFAVHQVVRAMGAGYVVAPHGVYNPAMFRKSFIRKWVYWWLFERRMLRHAAAIQLLDARHAQYLRRLRQRIVITANGFFPDEVPDESRLRWYANGPVEAGFLGRLDAHTKGLDLLLGGVAGIPSREDVKLTLQGWDTGDGQRLRRLAGTLGIAGRVAFREADLRRPGPWIAADYDVVCLPSRHEGFSMVAVDALLAGRVMLMSEVAAAAPAVEASGCGVLVRATVEGIVEGFERLLRVRGQWREMGLGGRRYALEKLRWERIAHDLLGQYEQLGLAGACRVGVDTRPRNDMAQDAATWRTERPPARAGGGS
jgi:glycosyltransferase involved in cell wall biosynthesis